MTLAWLAAAFVTGVALGTAVSPPLAVPLVIALLFALGAWWCRHGTAGLPLLMVAVIFLGTARSPHAAGTTSPSAIAYYNGRHIQLDGAVAEEPDIRDTGANYVIAVRDIVVGARVVHVTGKVQVHTTRAELLDYGDVVNITGRLLRPKNNPTLPYADILARRGIHSLMRFPAILNNGPEPIGLLTWIVPFREWLERGIDAWLPEPEAALLIAITLGARSASLGDLSPILVSTGLIHVIAISGIKVAMVAGTLHELARRLRSPRLALLVSLAAVWLYVLLTGATVSGERSALMWSLVFVAVALGRATVTLVSLSAAAALMIALDPTLPWDLAFLMSTVGTFAIVSFSGRLQPLVRYIPALIADPFTVTLSAQLGTLPIVVIGFHLVSLTGPVANALVLPLLPALILLGFATGASASIGWLASPLAAFAYSLLHGAVFFVGWMGSLPGTIPLSSFPAVMTVIYYAALARLALYLLRRANWAPVGRPPGSGRELFAAGVLGASLLTVSAVHARSGDTPHLTWLGTGDAILLQSAGKTALIDGSNQPYRLLEQLGRELPARARQIDLVVVTTSQAKNISALESVLDHYSVGEVLDVGAEYPSTTYARWRADLRARHIPVFALRTGASVQLGQASLTAIGPDYLTGLPADCAGMLRVTLPGDRFLLADSASQKEQWESVFRPVDLRADVLVGDSSDGYDAAFLRHVHPATVYTPGDTVPGTRTVPLSEQQVELSVP